MDKILINIEKVGRPGLPRCDNSYLTIRNYNFAETYNFLHRDLFINYIYIYSNILVRLILEVHIYTYSSRISHDFDQFF